MFRFARGIALLLAFALAMQAQSPTQNWNNIKALEAGADIRVNVNERRIDGRFQSATDESLIITSNKGLEALPRQEVVRVAAKGKGHRGRHVLIAMAAGAGAGAVSGAATDGGTSCNGFCIGPRLSRGEAAAIGAVLFGAIGALIGVVIPAGGWREVYTR